MKAIEDKGQDLGITKLLMMENAGSSIANCVYRKFSHLPPGLAVKVVAIAGTGNNGGDVMVAARHLAYWPIFFPTLILIGKENEIFADEARTNWEILSRTSRIRKVLIDGNEKFRIFDKEISKANAIIIGIFGTGFKGAPRLLQSRVIERINRTKNVLKISADIPSGMEADSGLSNFAVKSDMTVTMYAPK